MRATDLLTPADITSAGFLYLGLEGIPDAKDPLDEFVYYTMRDDGEWTVAFDVVTRAWNPDVWEVAIDTLMNPAATRVGGLGEVATYDPEGNTVSVLAGRFLFAITVAKEEPEDGLADPLLVGTICQHLARRVLGRIARIPAVAELGGPVRPNPERHLLVPDIAIDYKVDSPRKQAKALLKYWRKLLPAARDAGQELIRLYDEPSRSHDLSDLIIGLQFVDFSRPEEPDGDILRLAVWFHAAQCLPDGERDISGSVGLVWELLAGSGLSETQVREVIRLVQDPDWLRSGLWCLRQESTARPR